MKKLTILRKQNIRGTLFRIGSIALFALAMSSSNLYAQDDYTDGSPEWHGNSGKLYTVGAKVGIGTNSPFRKLHLRGAGHQYMRTTATSGDEYHTYVAGLELERILENGQKRTWDIVNQGNFKIRRSLSTLFQLDLDESQVGNQWHKTTFNVWGKHITNDGGEQDNGALALRNYISGQNQTMRLDGNQIETTTEMHLNFLSEQDVVMVEGGGAVRVNTSDEIGRAHV